MPGVAMTVPPVLADVTLLDVNGGKIGRCRVPRNPGLPAILVWSNRYFRLIHVNNQYLETTCYLVPLQDMYAGEPMPSAAPHKGKTR